MPRLAATSDQIRATVLAMLTEAGDAAPPTAARFRRVVSVRKLRDRLGGGDPATLSRTLNAIEAEVVRAGLADLATVVGHAATIAVGDAANPRRA